MKIAATILVLAGVVNLAWAFLNAQNGSWLNALFSMALGSILLILGAGMLKKKGFAWTLGFVVIALCVFSFVLDALSAIREVKDVERAVLLAAFMIIVPPLSVYCVRQWYRQRTYFSK